jgi:anthranilate phosphoribosyltransferase
MLDARSALAFLSTGASMTESQAGDLFSELLSGKLTDAQIGAVLGMIAVRGPSVEELVGAGRVMRQHVTAVPLPEGYVGPVLDTCGTGGTPKTFNISTAAALVAAAAARRAQRPMLVAKHGNRSRSGRGSAEVLERLGVRVDAPASVQTECLRRVGVCFCFAVHHHPAMKHAAPARQALGIPTIFNLLGPLTNPANADRQVLGVFADRFVEPMAESLRRLGAVRAVVFHSRDGMDEISVSAPTRIAEVTTAGVRVFELDPATLGIPRSPRQDLEVGTLDQAAEAVQSVLAGDRGAKRDAVLLAAAASLVVTDVAADWGPAIDMAGRAIDSGDARRILAELAETSRHGA